MANLSKLFQDEVRRLARKEVKVDLAQLKAENVALRRSVSELRHRLSTVEREKKRLARIVNKQQVSVEAEASPEIDRVRISAKTVRTLRQRLSLTQADFALLLGVSGQSVYQWERQEGRLELRQATKKALVEAKQLGAREARRHLEALEE